jgi:predicted amidohydrolase
MLLAAMQFTPAFGEARRNLRKIADLAAATKADLYVLPELATTGYQFANREEAMALAESLHDGPSIPALRELAAGTGAHYALGLAEREGDVLYNSAVLVGATGVVLHYRKIHLFCDEKDIFAPGNLGFPVADVPGLGVRVGALVCFDWLFPEAARCLALAGAEILLHPSNLVTPYGQQAMVTRSLENGVFTALCNRTGTEARAGRDRLTFTGRSRLISLRGEVLAELGATEEGVCVAEIDPAAARNKAITNGNDILGDRRPECYRPITGEA